MTDSHSFLHREFPGLSLSSSQLSSLMRALCVCTNNVLCILDCDGRILDVSLRGEELFGWNVHEVVHSPIQDWVLNARDVQELMERARKQSSGEGEIHFRHAQGHTVPCRLCLAVWTDQTGIVQGMLGVASDQSKWHKFQEDLVHIDRLTEMGRMAASIVHDLKNPLSIINQAAGWGKVVVEDAVGMQNADRTELSKTLEEIEKQTARCRSISNQILDYVRDSRPERKEFSLQALIEDTLRYMESELKHAAIQVSSNMPDKPVTVYSDYTLLQQVMVNIVSNAMHALGERQDRTGQLHIVLEEDQTEACIRITDNGPGIPESVQEHVFELFYTTKPEGMGTGLGLPICRKIVTRLGGSIWFETQVGTGTIFYLTMPKQRPVRA